MSELQGVLEEITEFTKTRYGRPMCNVLVDGVRIGKFFKDDADAQKFQSEFTQGSTVKVKFSVNGKYKNLESIELLSQPDNSTQETLPDTDNKRLAKAAFDKESKKIKDDVTGEEWSRETVLSQLKKDVKNIREMLSSMEKLVEVL